MALVVELEVDDKGTPRILKFEKTAKGALEAPAKSAGKLSNSMQRLGGFVKKVTGGFGVLFSVFKTGTKILGGAVLALAGIAFALDRVFKKVTEVAAIRFGFEQMSAAVGGANKVLADAKTATQGLVTELDLMRQFNNAVALGVVQSSKQFATLTKAALTLGRALGVGPQRAIDSLVIGIGRQSRLMLDNLGIIVSVEAANRKYAASLGRTVSSLTLAETKIAFMNESMVKLEAASRTLGDLTLFTSDKFVQLKTSVIDATNQILVGVGNSRALADAFEFIRTRASQVAGGMNFIEIGTIGASKAALLFIKTLKLLLQLSATGILTVNGIRSAMLNFSIAIARAQQALILLEPSFRLIMLRQPIKAAKAISTMRQRLQESTNTINEIKNEQDRLGDSTFEWTNRIEIATQELNKLEQVIRDAGAATGLFTREQREAREEVLLLRKTLTSLITDPESLEELVKIYEKDGPNAIKKYVMSMEALKNVNFEGAAGMAFLSDIVTRVKQEINAVGSSATNASGGMNELSKSAKKTEEAMKGAQKQLKAFQATAFEATVPGAFGVGALEAMAEQRLAIQESLGRTLTQDEETDILIAQSLARKDVQFQAFQAASAEFANTVLQELETTSNIGQIFSAAGKALINALVKFLAQFALQRAALFTLLGIEALIPPPNPFFNPAAAPSFFKMAALWTAAAAAFTAAAGAVGAATGAGGGAGGGRRPGERDRDGRQRRDRDRLRQEERERGAMNFVLLGDFIGDPRFIDDLATRITEASRERRVSIEVRDAETAATL